MRRDAAAHIGGGSIGRTGGAGVPRVGGSDLAWKHDTVSA